MICRKADVLGIGTPLSILEPIADVMYIVTVQQEWYERAVLDLTSRSNSNSIVEPDMCRSKDISVRNPGNPGHWSFEKPHLDHRSAPLSCKVDPYREWQIRGTGIAKGRGVRRRGVLALTSKTFGSAPRQLQAARFRASVPAMRLAAERKF
jgi:hypothetical protein